MKLSRLDVEEIIDRALKEDLDGGDVTTEAIIPDGLPGKASLLIKAEGIIAGIEIARLVFLRVDPTLQVEILISDGTEVKPGDIIAAIQGAVASILKAERVALNFLQRLSGIATETSRYVAAVQGLPTRITDTRKTGPGLRILEKYAVWLGGGQNHRKHLGDGILIKDNHLAALRSQGFTLRQTVAKARQTALPTLKVEVEVKTPAEALEAAEAGADIVMLDNMSLEDIRHSVELVKGRALIEASGGVTLNTVRAIAESGVDLISVGALTHSARALDISLELTA